jgi:hypothetical protein
MRWCGLLLSLIKLPRGATYQFLNGLSTMSLSKFELHSDAILIKDYRSSIGVIKSYHIFGRPRVSDLSDSEPT